MHHVYTIILQTGNIIGHCLAAFVTVRFVKMGLYDRSNMLNSSLQNNVRAFVFGG